MPSQIEIPALLPIDGSARRIRYKPCPTIVFFVLISLAQSSHADDPLPSAAGLPPSKSSEPGRRPGDWLIDGSSAVARISRGESDRELFLENGLVRRTFRLSPNTSTVGLDHLGTRESFLRSVRPEAILELDGKKLEVGGLVGARIHKLPRA